ncbi:Acyl-CoA desaturase 1 [Bagarius yarrelli]|uniref:stearoyl-CoA 9-desaturase n=1 Tax=Bagarius yarrelli TaxID=175774 RepID=A0A556VWY2_BAGYA|nr:Acyl-CoA desaturase 1 [Bagarius yarrelli]
MPILKQLVPGSSGSKRHSRADLTVEMISAPLADFRHTMHIGRGGDAFGDTSFLSEKHETTNQVQKNSLLPNKLRGNKRLQSDRNSSYMLTATSPNNIPSVRDQEVTICHPQSTSISFLETDRRSAVMGGRSLEEMGGWSLEENYGALPMFTPPPSRGIKPAESMLSFHIDLGPSILRDVLGVMDQSAHLQQNLTDNQKGRQQDRKTPSLLECVFTSSSGVTEHKTVDSQMCIPTYSVNINDKDFLFMDEDEEENDIYEWARDHRVHHKYSETDADPHNASRGFFFAHIGWLLVKKHPKVIRYGQKLDLSDLKNDRVVMFQRRFYKLSVLVMCFLIPAMIPWFLWAESLWVGFYVPAILRYTLVLNATWLVNSAAHMWGNRPYDVSINPRENRFVSFSAIGEGFHNYHHTFPQDYATSEFGCKLNLTTCFIDLMCVVGLAKDRRRIPTKLVIARAKRSGDGSYRSG